MRRAGLALLVGSLVLMGTMAYAAPKSTSGGAQCSVSDATPAVGERVTFTATGLNGGGTTRLEIISATDDSYYYDMGTIGSQSSYSEDWTFNEDGVFAAVFSRSNNGNVKCDAYVTVGTY
jgi:hypothetical protein